MPYPYLIVITGPTATGKTALGVALALELGGEVISADSMQVYRRMDVGTAKPTAAERRGVPHHMLDAAEPWEDYSAARWTAAATAAAEDILARGKTPIVVGGTGLYIDSLLAGRVFSPAPADSALRRELGAEYDAVGGEAFRERLRAVDPERADKLPPGDKRRLVRAMEVYALTGESITAHDERSRLAPPRFASRRFALTYAQRETLYERIRARVDAMAAAGLFAEVEALLAEGLSPRCTAMQAIGYKETAAALRGECSREEALEAVKLASCRYAKRQLTWLRRDRELLWLPREDFPREEELPGRILLALRQDAT